MLREDLTVGTLAAPLGPDSEFTAPAIQAAGFDAVFLTPSSDREATGRTRALLEDKGVSTFGFAPRSAPEPLILGRTALFGVTDADLPGWGSLSDAGYIKSCIDSADNSVAFLYMTKAARGPTAEANLERLKRAFIVSVGGRNPGYPDRQFAPGVFHDARRPRPGRPGLIGDVDGTIRRAVTQSAGPAAKTRFVDTMAEQALLFSLKVSQRASLDSTLFRAPG